MRLHRLIAILLLIESRGKMKAKDLAFALETSVRSIYRDLDVLAEAGIPIVTTPGPGGGIRLMEGYTVNLKQLNGDDVTNLYLTGMGIYSDGKTESGLKLQNTLLKLEKALPTSYQPDIQKAKARFYFDDTPWWTERVTIPCLEMLRIAVWRSQKLQIQYRKANSVCSSRIVHPYGLVVKKAEWYLVAYCERAGTIRTFKCENIIMAEKIDEEFEIPSDFSLKTHWHMQEAVFKQSCREHEYYPVRIIVKKNNTDLLKRLEVIRVMHQGDYVILTVNMYSYEIACYDLLDLIGHLEIVEPEALRRFARDKLIELLSMYS